MSETWLRLKNYSHYEVSSLGRVRNLKTGKFIKQFAGRKGYLRVALKTINSSPKMPTTHSLVLETFFGPRPAGYHGAHLDGNNQNNHLTNLKWVTPKENTLHSRIHGTMVLGERAPFAKLTEKDVRNIRREFKIISGDKSNAVVLAKKYNVDRTTIRRVISGKTWSHVK